MKTQNKAIVVVNGFIDCKFLYNFYKNLNDYFIVGVDNGFLKANSCNIKPRLYIGDLDSIEDKNILDEKVEKLIYKPQKDKTDLELAIEELVKRDFLDIDIIAVSGGRIDHQISHFFLLEKVYKQYRNVKIRLVDKDFFVYLIDKELKFKNLKGKIFSLLPLTDKVFVYELKGCKYPLENEYLYRWQLRGISNIIVDDNFYIKIKEGLLFFILVND